MKKRFGKTATSYPVSRNEFKNNLKKNFEKKVFRDIKNIWWKIAILQPTDNYPKAFFFF